MRLLNFLWLICTVNEAWHHGGVPEPLNFFFCFLVTLRPNADHGHVILGVSSSHTQRRTTVVRSPLDEWSARRRGLSTWQHTTLTTDIHPCPRRDSNPHSQQANGSRPTPLILLGEFQGAVHFYAVGNHYCTSSVLFLGTYVEKGAHSLKIFWWP